MTKNSRQKFKYLENDKSFWGEIKSIFHYFYRAFSCRKCFRPESLPLSFRSTTCDNFLSLRDFNIFRDEERLNEFYNSFSLARLIKTSTSYMATNTSSIDHIFTNMTSLLMKSSNIETWIPDEHKMILCLFAEQLLPKLKV